MTDFNPPINDIRFCMYQLAGLDGVLAQEEFRGVDADTIDHVLIEGARFARDVWAPTNIVGDQQGCRVVDRAVVTPDGFADAYAQFVENGWPSLSASDEYDGMGLPMMVGVAATEFWQTANLSLSLLAMLTNDAAITIQAHASDELKDKYLRKMISGEWAGTMCLTEPQAGSDLAAVTSRAVPAGSHYMITGTKIFITWGDHELSENIVHLVLARLPDAPGGVKGISLFLVPKYLLDDAGELGERNDVYATSVEHKLGIRGSATCAISFGDAGGAIGYLVGEKNRGLSCMFTMMNHARLGVGMQAISVSERAYQLGREFAKTRVQGRTLGQPGRVTIIHHADVRRMLLNMKSQVEAMRAVAYSVAPLMDLAHSADDPDARRAAETRLALLTPVVKGWMSEVAQEVTSLGIQVHGGMGYVEETGAAQYFRDARILPIYEGTTGIQAEDFCSRKILADEGREIRAVISDMRSLDGELQNAAGLKDIARLFAEGVDLLEQGVDWLLHSAASDPYAVSSASVNLLMLAGTVSGGWQMARSALASRQATDAVSLDPAFCEAKILTARFYCQHILPRAHAYLSIAMCGTETTTSLGEADF